MKKIMCIISLFAVASLNAMKRKEFPMSAPCHKKRKISSEINNNLIQPSRVNRNLFGTHPGETAAWLATFSSSCNRDKAGKQ